MRIPLKPGWENAKFSTKPYHQGPKERDAIDPVFDKLHSSGKMAWAEKTTPFGLPAFTV